MPIEIRHLQTLVGIWSRKDEPETADIQRALHIAHKLETSPHGPTHLRAFAWHLVVATHDAVGWQLPADTSLAVCRAAAASLAHAASTLMAEITEQMEGAGGPVVLLGALAASRAVFGRWDLVPGHGAVLVSLDLEAANLPAASELPPVRGVLWAGPDRRLELYRRFTVADHVDGRELLLPSPELVAARVSGRPLHPLDVECLLFCGAAHASVRSGRWNDVTRIASALGRRFAPLDVAVQLGIDRQLGLEVGALQRLLLGLRRRLTGHQKTRA